MKNTRERSNTKKKLRMTDEREKKAKKYIQRAMHERMMALFEPGFYYRNVN